MLFKIFHLIMIFHTTANTVGKEQKTNERNNNHSVPTHHQIRKDMEGLRNVLINRELFLNKDHLKLEARERNPEGNRAAKVMLPREINEGNRYSHGVLRAFTLRGNKKNSFTPQRFTEKQANIPEDQNAKKFWNYFVYKLNEAPEDFRHSVKTQEIQREVCKTLPFSQNITHENCDEVVIQNNLCFGKCNSLNVPNQREELNICSHCRPSKFRMHHLKLNCRGSSSVIKVVLMVEECKCMVHKHSIPGKKRPQGHQ